MIACSDHTRKSFIIECWLLSPSDQQQAPTSICQLPLEQLAQVLQQVELKARLGCCGLVCSMWHAAAVAATRSITTSVSFRSDAQSVSVKFLQLHAWLLKHGQEAALGNLSVTGPPRWAIREQLQLQLPVLQLAALTRLQLEYLSADFQKGTSSQQSSSAALPQEWTSLTHLGLRHCPLELGALAAFTQLQHLSLTGDQQETELAGVAAMASAMPSMQHLSHLELGASFAQDSLLTGVQHLPSLQVLLLQYGECTSRGLAQLPPTLTLLNLNMRFCNPGAADVTLSHNSTPGLTKLTALQRLEVNRATAVHPALLGCLHSLQHLSVTGGLLDVAAGEPGLAALSTLTALRHLQLCCDDWGDIAATPADCAGLTASSQLTFLSICADSAAPPGGLVADQQYIHH